jgi:protein SCO1/2
MIELSPRRGSVPARLAARRPLLWAAAAALLVFVGGASSACKKAAPNQGGRTGGASGADGGGIATGAGAPGAAPGASVAEPSSPSSGQATSSTRPLSLAPIYDLDVALVDQNGKTIGLDVFRGHTVIVSMFYASCPAACPRLIDDILAVEASLDEARRRDLRVLLVSFDAARDTPAALTHLIEARDLDRNRWRLAAASPDQARELAAVLGIKYRKLDDGEFFHTSVLTLLDEKGVPTASAEGLGRASTAMIAALGPSPR